MGGQSASKALSDNSYTMTGRGKGGKTMLKFLILAAVTVAAAPAAVQHRNPKNHRQFQDRQGFGVQGGFNAGDAFGVNAGVHAGDPFGGNDLIMPIIVGLGFLTALNILTDVFAWFNTGESPAKDTNDTTEKPEEAGRSGREITDMTFRVLDAIQNVQDKYVTSFEE